MRSILRFGAQQPSTVFNHLNSDRLSAPLAIVCALNSDYSDACCELPAELTARGPTVLRRQVVTTEQVEQLKVGEADKKKHYTAVVWERPSLPPPAPAPLRSDTVSAAQRPFRRRRAADALSD